MDASDFISALFGTALVVFLTHVLARRLTRDAVRVEQAKPGLIGRVIYYAAKWITIIGLVYLALAYLPNYLPPRWMERREQRKEVAKRVAGAGGWASLVQDTRILLATNNSPGLRISPRYETNFVLPPTIAALKPRDIQLEKFHGLSTAFVQIYGMHSTGGRGQAFYWLYIVDDGSPAAALEKLRSRLTRPRTIHQITNGVFEVY